MKKNIKVSSFIVAVVLLALFLLVNSLSTESSDSITTFLKPNTELPNIVAKAENRLAKLPDFTQYTDVKEKKEAFFTTLYPIIEYENQHILEIREAILSLQEIAVPMLTAEQRQWLEDVAKHYKVTALPTDDDFIEKLLMRVDYLPPSLALTQAAIESGWGSSRFSRKGNNLFGQWCFSEGCGMVPSSREDGKGHEVAKFKSVNHSVRAYLQNLNTNSSYISLRKVRAEIRDSNGELTGPELAKSLLKYSEEGPHYVKKVTGFINYNKLQRYTNKFEESLESKE